MLEIQRLVLNLPAGFESRAARIGRLTAEALAANLPASGSGHIEKLSIAPQTVQTNWSDRRIAAHLANAIASGVARTGGE
jgi:hypothetical protein